MTSYPSQRVFSISFVNLQLLLLLSVYCSFIFLFWHGWFWEPFGNQIYYIKWIFLITDFLSPSKQKRNEDSFMLWFICFNFSCTFEWFFRYRYQIYCLVIFCPCLDTYLSSFPFLSPQVPRWFWARAHETEPGQLLHHR